LPRSESTSATRRAFVAGAGGALIALAAGPGVARALAPDEVSEDDLACLQLAASAELLASAFYARAARTKWATGRTRATLQRAGAADRAHHRALSQLIGAGAPAASDLDVRYPRRTFSSARRAAAAGGAIERAVLGVYLSAAAGAESAALRTLAARAAAAEARHLAVLADLEGADLLGPALPRPLDLEAATRILSPYWGRG
jgi:rubrerythrin